MAKVAPATVTLPSAQSDTQFEGLEATNAVPASGIAIFPEWVSRDGQKLILKGSNETKGMIASNMAGTPLLFVDGEYSSSSSYRTITNAANNTIIYQIRKEGSGSKHYIAELDDDDEKPLFEITKRRRILHREKVIVTFVNKADPNRGMIEMEYTSPLVVSDGGFRIDGNLVVLVKKEGVGPASVGWYYLTIMAGIDPTLVVGAMVAVIDRLKDESCSTTAAF